MLKHDVHEDQTDVLRFVQPARRMVPPKSTLMAVSLGTTICRRDIP